MKFFFVFFLLCSKVAFNQKVLIKSNIQNEKKEPVSHAIIKIKNDSLGLGKKFVLTDLKGEFEITFNSSLPTKVWIEVTSVGYFTSTRLLEIHVEKNTLPSITLIENKKLPEVFVKSDKPIKINGDTTTFKVSEFVKGNEKNLNDLLANMPGFTVNAAGKISFNGKQVDKVLIENDDLLGNNYEKVTSNIGINGIEKVEVIDNFEDNESILSQFNNQSKKQVINLKYQKSKLLKVFGETEIGYNTQNKYAKLQLISLVNKLKSIAISGLNNTGNLYNSNEDETPTALNTELDLIDINFKPKQPLAAINENDIKPLNNIVRNNSSFITGSFFLKPTPNLTVKVKTNFTKNEYLKLYNATTTNYLFDTAFTFITSGENWFSKAATSNELMANYLLQKSQFVFTAKFSSLLNNNASKSNFQQNDLVEKNNFYKDNFFSKLNFSTILSKKIAITSFIQFSQHALSGNYNVNPSPMYNFFDKNFLVGNILQQETQHTKNNLLSFKIYSKGVKHKMSFNVQYQSNQSAISNQIQLLDVRRAVLNDSLISNKINFNELKISLEDTWSFSKNIKLNYGISFLNRGVEYNNIHKNKDYYIADKNVNPFASLSLNIKKNKKLFITYSLQNKIQDLRDFGSGFKIENLSTIGKSIDSFISKNTDGFNIIYSNIDFSSKKMILFTGFMYNLMPYINISNFNFNILYNVKEQIKSNRNLSIYNYFFRLDKFSKNMVYKFSPEANISYSKVYNVLNNIENENHNLNIKGALGFDFKPSKAFAIGTKLEYNIFGSSSLNTNTPLELNAQEVKYQLEINARISKLISINQSNNIYYFKLGNQFSNTVYMANLRLDFSLIQNKLSSDLSITNIFNAKDYTRNSITPIQVFNETHVLFSRLLMLNIKYLF